MTALKTNIKDQIWFSYYVKRDQIQFNLFSHKSKINNLKILCNPCKKQQVWWKRSQNCEWYPKGISWLSYFSNMTKLYNSTPGTQNVDWKLIRRNTSSQRLMYVQLMSYVQGVISHTTRIDMHYLILPHCNFLQNFLTFFETMKLSWSQVGKYNLTA